MKLTKYEWWRAGRLGALCLIAAGLLGMTPARTANAQGLSTTTVQGTVYLANGQAGAGTLLVSWPAFTTATGQAVAADSLTVTIPEDGFLSVNLAPNVGALPAGEYYTAVFYMSDGSVNTQYWQVPAGAQATLAQVETQIMPAAQAVQAVSKAYVDQSITELMQSLLTASGGTLGGPLILNADPTQALQAADKHYVDTQVATAVPLAGGNMTGALGTPAVNGVEAPAVGSAQTTLQQAMNAAGTNGAMQIPPTYGGTDAFTNANGVRVTDLRTSGAQQTERSVKEFGAVCDGATDDTNALQAALNYANAHGVALTIPEGTCKTRSLSWHGESIGGMGKQVSALMGFPGQDVLASITDTPNLLQYTRLHDLTIYVDQSLDVSCSAAEGRAAAGSCQVSRLMEKNSIFSPGGNGLTGTVGTGVAWAVGNCAIAMPAATGTGGNGLRVAEMENLEIAATGTDPMAAQYPGAHSTHTCGMYLAQWPQWSEFRNIDMRGLNTGVAIPALPVTTPAGLNADSNRWQNVTIQATHAFTAEAGSNNVLDNVVAMAGNSSATGEPPTGLVLDFAGAQQGWTVRNAVVLPTWNAVQPTLTVAAAGGAVTTLMLGTEHGLGWDPYGTSLPVAFSGSCTAQATATVNSSGAIGSVSVTQGGVGCSATTTASVNAAGTWDTAAPVNLISGQEMTLFAGNLLKGNGGYTVWNAASSASYGTQLDGGGGTLPGGGAYGALVGNQPVGTTFLVDQFPGTDIGAKIQACLGTVSASYGGTCDARNFTGNLSMGSNLTISTGNTTVLLPCATIATAHQVIVAAGTRNVALRGCAMRGGSAVNGSQGGTAFAYSGTGAMVQVGDPTYATDTLGFHMDNVVINTTAATSSSAKAMVAYRTQEMDLESLYLLGNGNQTGITLDGTGNYTGGTFLDDQIGGFQTAVNAIGHQLTNPATTDWMNASTFVRLHIDCPTASGSPISGTYGINLQQGDGNTFTGGDVEGCATALHLGANAQNNTIVGLRNENSTSQVVADAGSSYNNWMTGGTMFTGQLTDNGTRNSFLDTFHRSFNGLNGDWYGSQQDATVTNHYRLGIGTGNERGLLNEVQTDYGYRWLEGYSDATSGEQLYQVDDLLNNVNRLSIGQYNHGQSSTNNQTLINAAGTGAVVLNGSTNAGTGGVVIGSGGASEATVATISNAGNAQFNGTLQVGNTAQSAGTMTVRNSADAEVDYYLWPGLTTTQKGSFTYKDWNGNSQWYLVKDQYNNWMVNSAVGGLDSFKAYQSTNGGDTYIDSSNSTGHIRMNYETGAGAETDIYSGGSLNLVAAFLGTTSIKFPGLAAGSGRYCLQIDSSGYLTNTGSACGIGSGSGSGTVNSGFAGQIAFYASNGTAVGGMNTIPVTAGGTGSATAAGALASLGGQAALPGLTSDGANGIIIAGAVTDNATESAGPPKIDIRNTTFAGGAICDNGAGHSIDAALQAAWNAMPANGVVQVVGVPGEGCYWADPPAFNYGNKAGNIEIHGPLELGTTLNVPYNQSVNFIGIGGADQETQFSSEDEIASIEINPLSGTVGGTLGTAVPSTTGTISSGSLNEITIASGSSYSTGSTVVVQGAASNSNPLITTLGALVSGTTYDISPSATAAVSGAIVGSVITFTPSNMHGLLVGAGIMVSGNTSCSPSSSARTSNQVSMVCTPGTHIPAGVNVTVASCSDTSYNGSFLLVSDDYPSGTMVWAQTGSNSTTSGCTVTGFNEDSTESTNITSITGSTATAPFWKSHSSSDTFSVWAVELNGTGSTLLKNLSTAGGLWIPNTYEAYIDTVNDVGCWGNNQYQALEIDNASFTHIDKSSFSGCNGNPWAAHLTQYQYLTWATGGAAYFDNTWFSNVGTGIKVDHGFATLYLDKDVFEHPVRGAVALDMNPYWDGNGELIQISNSLQQDGNGCWVYQVAPSFNTSKVYLDHNYYGTCNVNAYWAGSLKTDTNNSRNTQYEAVQGVEGVFNDGKAIDAEMPGEQAGLSPAVVPFATANIPQSPSGWNGTYCTITSGITAPDGTSTAGSLTGSTYSFSTMGALTGLTPAVGDTYLFGGWAYTPTANAIAATGPGGVAFNLSTNISTHFTISQGGIVSPYGEEGTGAWDSNVANQGWHPVVGLATVESSDSTSGQSVSIQGGCGPGTTMEYWNPWIMEIPASASIGVPEIMRIREQMMHGYVPPNATAGQAYSNYPIELPADPTSNLEAATKHYVDNSVLAIKQLTGDVTAGPGSGSVAATVVQVEGAAIPTSATVVGTNSSRQLVATTVAANTVFGNGAGSTAPPTALAMPSCSASNNALLWTSGTGFGCNTISTASPAAFAAVTITSNTGTLATSGGALTSGTVALSHSSATTINVSGLVNGASFQLELTQDSTGGNTLTLGTGCTWLQGSNAGPGFVASTTPSLAAGANAVDLLQATYDGTNCLYVVN